MMNGNLRRRPAFETAASTGRPRVPKRRGKFPTRVTGLPVFIAWIVKAHPEILINSSTGVPKSPKFF